MKKNINLEAFLQYKTLYYEKIDFNIVKEAWGILSEHITLPYVIHIIGTNGKGSTGRFLSSFLHQLNFKVLHYSSPHIVEFNERVWIDGKNCPYSKLELAHEKLQKILPQYYLEKLTYFEYTTLLALLLSDQLDYLVLEAGLGGEFDATNIVQNNLTLLTTIGLDHQNFLGDTIEKITLTKARSCDNSMIIGYQESNEVYEIIDKNFKFLNKIIKTIDQEIIELDNYKDKLPEYLLRNLKLAFCALNYLQLDTKEFVLPKLFGRYQKILKNVTIDVGHNPLAAKVLYAQIVKEDKTIVLIYNSYADKDYKEVLNILKPVISEVQIIRCDDARIVKEELLIDVLESLHIKYKKFDINLLDKNKDYLVFGSFLVVENFLKVSKSGK